jgi:hypothetical protein
MLRLEKTLSLRLKESPVQLRVVTRAGLWVESRILYEIPTL